MADLLWTPEEELFTALLWARGEERASVKCLHDAYFPERTEDALSNSRWQREGVREWIERLEAAPLPADHPDLRELERQLTVARSTIGDLRVKLQEADKGADLFHHLAEVISTCTVPFEPTPPVLPAVGQGEYTPASLVSVLSDTHADMVVHADQSWGMEDFDFNIFRIRAERWGRMHIEYLTEHLPRHLFEEWWVLGLGDYIHGDIHGAGPRNHFRNTMKAAVATGDVLAEILYWVHQETGVPVRMVSVSGNHPRRSNRKDYDGPQDNFDYLVAVQAATRLQNEPEIEIVAPHSWTAFVEIRDRLWCLNHGDDVKGYAGHPWYGFSRKNNRIQALVGRKKESVDYFVYGHYHTYADVAETSFTSIHNGSFSLTDPYALENLSVGSLPIQRTFVVDDNRGIILDFPIYVTDPEAERAYRAGSHRPAFGRYTSLDLVSPEGPAVGGLNIIGRKAVA